MDIDDHGKEIARYYLEQWARWLLSPGGWSHRSPSDRWADLVSIGNAGFHSMIPHGVEPGSVARLASFTMQEVREMDGKSATILEAVYLRRNGATMTMVAESLGITPAGLNSRRRRAEQVFFGVLRTRAPKD